MPTIAVPQFERSRRGLMTEDEVWRFEATNDCHTLAGKYHRECEGEDRAVLRVCLATGTESWEFLPAPLKRIREAIAKSRKMLNLSENWDEDGAKPIDLPTWERAASFLSRYAKRIWDRNGRVLDVPDITPSVDGSVDIHWDKPSYEILIVIPSEVGAMASFYGDDRSRAFIKGEFAVEDLNEGLLEWLIKT